MIKSSKNKAVTVSNIGWMDKILSFNIYFDTTSPNKFKLLLKNRKSQKNIELEYRVKMTTHKCRIFVDLTKTNMNLGKSDFYLYFENRDEFLRLRIKSNSVYPEISRYINPIKEKAGVFFVPFLTVKNGLSIHCSNLLHLENKSYLVVDQNLVLKEAKIKDSNIIFRINDYNLEEHNNTYVVLKNKNTTLVIPFILDKENNLLSINISDLPSCREKTKMKWNIYIEVKKNQIIERLHVNLAIFQSRNSIDIGKRDVSNFNNSKENVFFGNLNVVVSKKLKRNFSFFIQDKYVKNAEKINFYVKKRKDSDEIINLKYNLLERKNRIQINIPLNQFVDLFDAACRLDLYAEIKYHNFTEKLRVSQYFGHYKSVNDKFIGFHKFHDESLGIVPYITNDDDVSFHVCARSNYINTIYPASARVKRLKMKKDGTLFLTTELRILEDYNFNIKGIRLKLRSDSSRFYIIKKEDIKIVNISKNKFAMSFELRLSNLELEQFYWDFYVDLLVGQNKQVNRQVRIKNSSNIIKTKLQYRLFKYTLNLNNGYKVYPYITKGEGLSLTYRLDGEYEKLKYKVNELIAFLLYSILKYFFNPYKIWIIHEKYSGTAQDNGYYFFKNCYEKHYNKKAYFVIKKESDDLKNIQKYKDRILYFMSIKHLFYLLVSYRIISSEAKGHGYAWRVSRGLISNKIDQKRYVFLQHGVLGLKKVDRTFNANGANHADLFITSSDFEKEIVKKYFGYKDHQILVSGLSRWDAIPQVNSQETNEIFLMPTWRNWLDEVPVDEFIESSYFKQYSALLQSKRLNTLLGKNKTIMNFYVHPKFMPYVENFKTLNSNIRILSFGDEQINVLLMRSKLLITDYSSIAWEAFYQNKPVLFFHFDLDKYLLFQGSYMDLKKDLFGDVAYDSNDLIALIQGYLEKGYKQEKKYQSIKNRYYSYSDNMNSERIYEAVRLKDASLSIKKEIGFKLMRNPIIRTIRLKFKDNNKMVIIVKKLMRKLEII